MPAGSPQQAIRRRSHAAVTSASMAGCAFTAPATPIPVQLLDATAVSVRSDLGTIAAALHIPTLVLWGEQDALVPVEVGQRLTELIPGARLHVLPGAGHQPQWEAPDAFHAAVLPFLAEV
jgi:pimeloyl-ACP methyl ester carboxylesterase